MSGNSISEYSKMNVTNRSDDYETIPWSDDIERLNFHHRICTTFIAKQTRPECCVCNYKHNENDASQSHERWDRKKHTEREVTHCYGLLPQSNSPYIRCDIETKPEEVCIVLFSIWYMSIPNLIMRMIGDIDTTPSVKIEKELLQGISDAAVASDAWIITNGYKEDSITELIGEVVYDCRMKNNAINFNAIAVGKWGNIDDCHKLNNSLDYKQPTTVKGHGKYKLERNHTQYIFFDDGTCDSLDTDQFASDLAWAISREARRRIPLINVLVGGTLYSLASLHCHLKENIPVVIVPGCGPLGDLLYKYLKLTDNTKQKDSDPNDENATYIEIIDEATFPITNEKLGENLRFLGQRHSEFIKDIEQSYENIREQQYEAEGRRLPVGRSLTLTEKQTLASYLKQTAECLESFRSNIHIFEISSSISLKETIYKAFTEARKTISQTKKKFHTTVDEEIQMALRWSIGDIIEKQSVTIAKTWNDTKKITQNRSLLIDAVSKNLLVFVMNFVELDIDFTTLFGADNAATTQTRTYWSPKYHYLEELYSDTKRKNPDPLYLLDRINTKINFTEEKHVVMILKELVGDFMDSLYEDPSTSSKTEEDEDAEYIYRDLFLWCVLTYRLDMAKIFLSKMKTRICSALIASKILKSLALYAPDDVAKDALTSKATEFENHAIEFVRCAYFNDKAQTCELIMRRVNLYKGVTCLQVAIAADDKKFIHEDACQALLTNIWYDKVDPVAERNRLIINMITMGIAQLFASTYQRYSSKNSSIRQKENIIKSKYPKRRLKKHGIDYTDNYGINGTILEHFFHFHNRPIIKYSYTCLGYVLFLIFFSYYMLYSFVPISSTSPTIHWTEILTIITVTTMLFEELRQFFFQDGRSLLSKLRTYFDLNNRMSNLFLVLPSYLLFYIGLILRFTQRNPNSFAFARVVLAIDLELWFICSILLIGITSNLGPKIVMIRKMTSDLLLFIIIIVIFIFGYGITSRSMIAYGTLDFSAQTFFRDIVNPVYYFVHGSFDNERTQLEATPGTSAIIVTQVMFAFHMLFVNILLMNLLIALFSFTINEIQTKARYIWAYDRCDIIKIYYNRPALFPPFTCLITLFQFCRWSYKTFYRNCCTKKDLPEEPPSSFEMIPTDNNVDHTWSQFEQYSTNSYIRKLLDDQATALAKGIPTDIMSESSTTSSDDFKRIRNLINGLQEELAELGENNNNNSTSVSSTINELQAQFEEMDDRLDQSRQDMKEVKSALDWMMKAMVSKKMSETNPPVIHTSPRKNSVTEKQSTNTSGCQSRRRSSACHASLAKSSQEPQLPMHESPVPKSCKK